ncbi:uncharacterized protein LOC124287926 [Haliotis rubra]|uniref:uncharacterized protein LOC124287926 n=1 Tax=Haliotis rubra TaxID=36100 RepID=UPI001EE50649|nr:uncharacterized protein LOC124287926 [Haliotis rubra]
MVHDAGTCSQAKDDTETNIVQSGVSESVKREESPKSQTINVEESFVEHLMSLNEEYREQLEATRKELRMERESKAQIVKDLEHYRVEYKNFKLSWTMDQAEITDLKARVQTLDTFQRQMKRMNDTITRLERENNTLKARYLDTDGQTPVFEETRAAMAPKMPSPPAEGHARRRPYTGKARDVKTPVLPPITDNNNVVMSSKQTASSDKRELTLQHICRPWGTSAPPHHHVHVKTLPADVKAGFLSCSRQSAEHRLWAVSHSITSQSRRVGAPQEPLRTAGAGGAMNRALEDGWTGSPLCQLPPSS